MRCAIAGDGYDFGLMRDVAVLLIHLLSTIARLIGPGGARSVVAESLLLKHQLMVLNRPRQRARNLRPLDRIATGLCVALISPSRLTRCAIVLKPSTLLGFHKALVKRKYRLLFSAKRRSRPGPKGPALELIDAVVEAKRRNPTWGCPRITQQISLAFGLTIDKDVVRRVLASHYRPTPGSGGPSWLTFLGHMKDSLWSIDMFRCESAALRSHWVLVVMDHWTRRIVGFAVHAGDVDGVALCRMFNQAIGRVPLPKYLSSDHDPLYRFHRWQANLRVLEITEVKTVPYVPISHPFVERLIGTIRRECLDNMLFWGEHDLEQKLADFKTYYNAYRVHSSVGGTTPAARAGERESQVLNLGDYRWQSHCDGLYRTPMAA